MKTYIRHTPPKRFGEMPRMKGAVVCNDVIFDLISDRYIYYRIGCSDFRPLTIEEYTQARVILDEIL